MDTYFTEINYVLLASRGYEYDGFLFSFYKELDYRIPPFMEGKFLVPFPTVNAQTQGKTQGKITDNIPYISK
jgi:hypothetical protein